MWGRATEQERCEERENERERERERFCALGVYMSHGMIHRNFKIIFNVKGL